MIEVIEFDLNLPSAREERESLNEILADGFQIIGHATYHDVDRQPWERFTLYKPDNAAAKVSSGDLILTTITTIQRDETRNNQRPMWRCVTDDNHKVNIFLNVDEPAKDNFHLFEKAGYAPLLNSIMIFGVIDAEIQIAMRKDGQWWEIVAVRKNRNQISDYSVPSEADGGSDE